MSDAARDHRNQTIDRESIVGPGWFIGILLLLAVMAGVFAFNQFNAAGGGGERPAAHVVKASGAVQDDPGR